MDFDGLEVPGWGSKILARFLRLVKCCKPSAVKGRR